MQDQAFLGPESGLAVPGRRRRRRPATSPPSGCTSTATRSPRRSACRPRRCASRWPASAARSAAARTCRCRCTPACSRCTPAGRCKMVYNREESFFGHVHRHPARMRYEHGATRDGRLVYVRAGSCSTAAPTRRARRPSSATPASLGARALRGAERRASTATSSTPTTRRAARCAASARCRPRFALRGADGQAGRRARARPGRAARAQRDGARRPAAHRPGRSTAPAPVAELLAAPARRCRCPPPRPTRRPARAARRRRATPPTARACARGVGYAVGLKNVGFSEGFDDYSTARVRLALIGGEPVVDGAHRGGRGRPGPGHRRRQQIARTELGVERVVVLRRRHRGRLGRARPRRRGRRT